MELTCVIVLLTRVSGEMEKGVQARNCHSREMVGFYWDIQGGQGKERQSGGGFSSDIRLYSSCITPQKHIEPPVEV
jgi:hypothetical protein